MPSSAEEIWDNYRAAIVRRFDHPGPAADAEVETWRIRLVEAMGEDPHSTNVVRLADRRRAA
jgi:hypothetical protein